MHNFNKLFGIFHFLGKIKHKFMIEKSKNKSIKWR